MLQVWVGEIFLKQVFILSIDFILNFFLNETFSLPFQFQEKNK